MKFGRAPTTKQTCGGISIDANGWRLLCPFVGAAKVLFWGSLAGIAWTQAGYPATALVLARLRRQRSWSSGELPAVTVIVAAYNEESVIERRVANLRALD